MVTAVPHVSTLTIAASTRGASRLQKFSSTPGHCLSLVSTGALSRKIVNEGFWRLYSKETKMLPCRLTRNDEASHHNLFHNLLHPVASPTACFTRHETDDRAPCAIVVCRISRVHGGLISHGFARLP